MSTSLKERVREKAYEIIGLEVDPRGQDEMYLIRDEDGEVTDGIEFSEELDEIEGLVDMVLDHLLASLPGEEEIPLQQYDYDEIPDEKLNEIAINWRIAGANMKRQEIKTLIEGMRG